MPSIEQTASQLTQRALQLDFPPMPRTLTEILDIRSEEKPDMSRLLEITQSDPAITAGVLRRINSAYYGVKREITKLDRAMTLLGFSEVCSLAYTAAVKKAIVFRDNDAAKEVYDHIMRVSIATAAVARHLAEASHLRFKETAFTAGLLHQLGRIVLLYSAPEAYAELWYGDEDGEGDDAPGSLRTPSVVAEHRLFNTSYLQVGTQLAERWNLAKDVRTVMQYHLHYNKVHNPYELQLTLLVTTGGMVAHRLFEGGDASREKRVLRELADRCKVGADDLAAVISEKEDEVRQFTSNMC